MKPHEPQFEQRETVQVGARRATTDLSEASVQTLMTPLLWLSPQQVF